MTNHPRTIGITKDGLIDFLWVSLIALFLDQILVRVVDTRIINIYETFLHNYININQSVFQGFGGYLLAAGFIFLTINFLRNFARRIQFSNILYRFVVWNLIYQLVLSCFVLIFIYYYEGNIKYQSISEIFYPILLLFVILVLGIAGIILSVIDNKLVENESEFIKYPLISFLFIWVGIWQWLNFTIWLSDHSWLFSNIELLQICISFILISYLILLKSKGLTLVELFDPWNRRIEKLCGALVVLGLALIDTVIPWLPIFWLVNILLIHLIITERLYYGELVQRQKTEGKEEIDDLKYVRLFGFAVVLVTVLKLLWIFPEKFNLFGIIEQNDAAYYSLLAFFTLIMAVICNYHWQNSKSLFKSKLRQSREFMFNIFVIGVAVYFAQATLTLFKGEPYSLAEPEFIITVFLATIINHLSVFPNLLSAKYSTNSHYIFGLLSYSFIFIGVYSFFRDLNDGWYIWFYLAFETTLIVLPLQRSIGLKLRNAEADVLSTKQSNRKPPRNTKKKQKKRAKKRR